MVIRYLRATSPSSWTSTCSAAFDLDGFVSERIKLEDVNDAFETMKTGRVLT